MLLNSLALLEGSDRVFNEDVVYPLNYVEVTVGGHKVVAMIDPSASNNYVSSRFSKLMRWKLEDTNLSYKVQNHPSTNVSGMIRKISLQVEAWQGSMTLYVIPME